jgi:hypothetical protein
LQQALEQLAFWFNPRQDSNAEQDTQKGFGKILSRMCLRDGSILPACVYRKLNPSVLMMKSAQDGVRTYDAGSLNRTRDRRILVQ